MLPMDAQVLDDQGLSAKQQQAIYSIVHYKALSIAAQGELLNHQHFGVGSNGQFGLTQEDVKLAQLFTNVGSQKVIIENRVA